MNAKKARRKKIWRRVRRSCYAAAGLLFVALVGISVYGYNAWPVPNPEQIAAKTNQTVTINYANGEELTHITPDGGRKTMVRDLNAEVSKPMQHAAVSAEDASFYDNPGFDLKGILAAVLKQFAGRSGGGSTITQQYIKLELDKDAPTYTRKIQEVVVAFKMTNEQSKEEILKAYLNTAYYGRGANGIHAAAEAYFGKTPIELTPDESAVLAGVVQSPSANDPARHPQAGQDRWEYVIKQMNENGFISPAQYQSRQMPTTRKSDEWRGEGVTGTQYQIRNQVENELEAKGYTEQDLMRGGYTITTTIDKPAQQAAEAAVNKVMQGQPENLRTSLVATDPNNGQIRAYFGGGTEVGGLDYANTPQQPGSSFKPFVAIAGLQMGVGIGELYDGRSPQDIAGTKFENSEGIACSVPDQCGVREAMTESVNTVFVNMANRFGPNKVADAAHAAGIPGEYDSTGKTLQSANGQTEAGVALGMYPVRPIDMANSFGTIANDGKRSEPTFVAKLSNSDGVEELRAPAPVAAFGDEPTSKNVASNVIETMREVADASKIGLAGQRPVASKTGTHQLGDTGQNQNAWMVGSTPQLSSAVAMLAGEGNEPVQASGGKKVYGSGLPGSVWQEFMNTYHQGKPPEDFPKPSKEIGQFKPKPPATPEPPPMPTQSPTMPTEPPSMTSGPSESATSSDSESSKPTESTDGSGQQCGGLFNPCDEEDEGGQGGVGGTTKPTSTR